jgi:hypothetical protein
MARARGDSIPIFRLRLREIRGCFSLTLYVFARRLEGAARAALYGAQPILPP